MADLNNENQNGVFGGFTFGENNVTENASNLGTTQNAGTNGVFGNFGVNQAGSINEPANAGVEFKPIDKQKAVTKQGLWTKIKAFLFQEIDLTAPIKVELTPYQQKVENEINEFLHQEISFKGITKLFGKK
jgi:hypothetical protein